MAAKGKGRFGCLESPKSPRNITAVPNIRWLSCGSGESDYFCPDGSIIEPSFYKIGEKKDGKSQRSYRCDFE